MGYGDGRVVEVTNGKNYLDIKPEGSIEDGRISKASLGQYGLKRITGTTAVTPDEGFVFVALQAETEAVIDETTGDVLNGGTIGAEAVRYGRYTSLKLTSGIVIAYQGV